jgi:hypothetical protein
MDSDSMSKAAVSLRVFSLYMFVLGVTLVVDPNLLLSTFGFAQTREVWIRIVGLLVLIVGYFDFMASRSEYVPFFHWSVHARLVAAVLLAVFVALGLAPSMLLLFGLIDGVAAIWTAICLRRDAAVRSTGP